MKKVSSSLQEGGILARNTIINLAGQGLPLLFAVAAIPFVIEGLGTERFGVLTIVWIVIGYFGLFDMGIGRATTKFVADFEARGEQNLYPIIITSIGLLTGFGVLGSLIVVGLTPYLVYDILNIPAELTGETETAFYILSVSIPLVLGSIGARGALEAQQRFGIVNAVKIPASILNYVGPLLILPFSTQLQPVVTVLVAGRTITFGVYLYFCLRGKGATRDLAGYPVLRWAKELLGFGAWITVSNFISPIMVYMDRFILGAILTMSAVAYYTTPYEVVSRLLIVSGSFMGVMFPAFSVYSLDNKEKLTALHQSSIRYLLLALVPVVTFLLFFARPLLQLWLGAEFAANSTGVLQILAVGILVNSIAAVPYTALQASGRPDITAKLHMVELPVYLWMIWYFATRLGIVGVALAWTVRVTLDVVLLLYFFNRLTAFFRGQGRALAVSLLGYGLLFAVMGAGFQYIQGIYFVGGYALLCALAVFGVLWKWTLEEEERERVFRLAGELKEAAGSLIRRGAGKPGQTEKRTEDEKQNEYEKENH